MPVKLKSEELTTPSPVAYQIRYGALNINDSGPARCKILRVFELSSFRVSSFSDPASFRVLSSSDPWSFKDPRVKNINIYVLTKKLKSVCLLTMRQRASFYVPRGCRGKFLCIAVVKGIALVHNLQ